MIVPVVQCNCCRCHIETDGIRLLGGFGLLLTYKPGLPGTFEIAERPLEDAQLHLCTNCLLGIRNLPITGLRDNTSA